MKQLTIVLVASALVIAACSGPDAANNGTNSGTDNAAACDDGTRNGDETDVDCGGPDCALCAAGMACSTGADCALGRCTDGLCVGPACDDGVKNGDETDVDCGGTCDACADGSACDSEADCDSGTCIDSLCATPTCGDGIVNQDSELCDEGEDNGVTDACSADCTQKLCLLGEDVDTIQQAIDDDTCWGVWLPNGPHQAVVELDRPFRIVGESTDAILSPDSTASIVTTTADFLELRDLTLTGGDADSGGAVFASRTETQDNGRLVIDGVVFDQNQSAVVGGAVAAQGYDVEMSNVTFTSNVTRAASGTTAEGGGMSVRRGSLVATDCRFEGNEASVVSGPIAAAYGGALAGKDASAALTNVDFVGNLAIATADEADGGAVAYGGAIGFGIGTISVDGGEVTNNVARSTTTLSSTLTNAGGGGFFFGEADATVTGTRFQGNGLECSSASTVRCRGGALNILNKTATIDGVTVSGNTIDVTGQTHMADDFTVGGGAGLAAFGEGTTTVTDSTFSANTVTADIGGDGLVWGGAILVGGVTDRSAIYINRSTLADNHASITAGGIAIAAGGGVGGDAQHFETDVYVVNSTVSQNSVDASSASLARGSGGGIALDKAPGLARSALLIRSSTIVGNEASHEGGGISTGASGVGTEATVANSIIIDNVAPTEKACHGSVLTSLGFNLLQADVDCPRTGSAASDVIDATAVAAPLQDNGGPTMTHAIDAGSAAVDAADPSGCTDNTGALLDVDQRGMPRDAMCDIGAFELQ